MNRHTKLGLLIAPFLLIGSYIATDFYLENKADQQKVFMMTLKEHCDIFKGQCILNSGDFEINVYDKDGVTTLNSTFPLDSATLFIVDNQDQAQAYPLAKTQTAYYWSSATPLSESRFVKKKQKLRFIANIRGGQYISEFYSQTPH